MSQQNAEIISAIFRGWNDAGVEGMLPFCHEEFDHLPTGEASKAAGLSE
jgi:hypothetical protein